MGILKLNHFNFWFQRAWVNWREGALADYRSGLWNFQFFDDIEHPWSRAHVMPHQVRPLAHPQVHCALCQKWEAESFTLISRPIDVLRRAHWTLLTRLFRIPNCCNPNNKEGETPDDRWDLITLHHLLFHIRLILILTHRLLLHYLCIADSLVRWKF